MTSRATRGLSRRMFLKAIGAAPFARSLVTGTERSEAPATLYNGIRLATPWPPERRSVARSPLPPPYLVDPPDVIPIDVGRQLFVDDFLVEDTALERVYHRPEYHAASPVLRPTTAWEKRDDYAERTKTRSNPAAMVFSDGVFYDPADRLFKMWYMGGYSQNVCFARSHDGVAWDKPALDVVAGTNITYAGYRDSSTVWLDLEDPDPERRYKMADWYDRALDLHVSRDGIHWRNAGRTGPTGDRSTFFYNPFRKVWVYSLRNADSGVRFRRYFETSDFTRGVDLRDDRAVPWVGADDHDLERPEYHIAPELYNLDCVAYESVLLGLFTIFHGERGEREKPNDVCVGFSRDGFHWDRPDRRAFLPVSEHVGAWNWANVQSAGGCCLVVGDRLYFYVSGRRGIPGANDPGTCTTGLATLRRDGFASMDAPASGRRPQRLPDRTAPGTLLTRPLRFAGRYLFVNVDAREGELRVEAVDRGGTPLPGFTLVDCEPVRGDATRARVRWRTADHLGAMAGQPVRFRFQLSRGSLYAFWVSAAPDGASGGYVAAGGPEFRGPRDTTGAPGV